MRFALSLPQRQARMVALAVAYHLAPPGTGVIGAPRVGAHGHAPGRKCDTEAR